MIPTVPRLNVKIPRSDSSLTKGGTSRLCPSQLTSIGVQGKCKTKCSVLDKVLHSLAIVYLFQKGLNGVVSEWFSSSRGFEKRSRNSGVN